MCDEDTFADGDRHAHRTRQVTRREFGVISAGAGLAAVVPGFAAAAVPDARDVTGRRIVVKTDDGNADAYFVHPSEGRHPGVMLWPDAFGLRPAMEQMATRLARQGYAVLAVNPYYRIGRPPLPAPGADFKDPKTRDQIMSMIRSLTPEVQTRDARVFVDYLDAQAAVDSARQMGTMGYCMGGPMAMRTAAARAERIGAGASFHGGRLVTDDADSPHLLVPRIDAPFLFAIAANDDERQPEAKTVLRRAFDERGIPAEIEVYEHTLHGWCPPDSQVYDEAAAERAWARLLELFGKALV